MSKLVCVLIRAFRKWAGINPVEITRKRLSQRAEKLPQQRGGGRRRGGWGLEAGHVGGGWGDVMQYETDKP